MVSKSSFTSKLTRDPRQRAEQYSREGRKQKAAEMYARAGDFRQAARLAIEAGDERLAVECSIKAAFCRAPAASPPARPPRPAPPAPPTSEQIQAFEQLAPLDAAELLDAHGHHDEAIGLFELVRAYRRAAASALVLGQSARAARLFERGRAFYDAAVAYENAELLNDAARVLEIEAGRLRKERGLDAVGQEHLAQVELRRVDVLRKQGKDAEAAALLRDLRPSSHSVRLLEESGRYREAIEAALQMGDAEAAVRLLRSAPDIDRQLAAQIYLRSGHAVEAGNLFAALGRSREAAEAYESGGDWAKAGSRWETAQEQERAAEAYLRARRPRDAARCYVAMGKSQLAATAYAQAGDHAAAAAQYLKARQRVAAAAELLAAGDRAEASQVLMQIADNSPERETATLMLVPLLLEDGRAEEALRRLRQLPPMRPVALASTGDRALPARERLYWLGRALEQLGNLDQAEDCYRELADPTVAHLDALARLAVVRERRRAAAEISTAVPPPPPYPTPPYPKSPPIHPTYPVRPTALSPGGGPAAPAGAFTAGSAILAPPPRAGSRVPTDELATHATTALTPAAALAAATGTGTGGDRVAKTPTGMAARRREGATPLPPAAAGGSRPIGTLVVGQVLAGRFQILAEIGQGGMGRVYKARDFELGDLVAIKVLIAQPDDGSADAERLLREVQICRRITHPNVVRVFDLGRHEGAIFIIMELLEGQALVDLIDPERRPPLARVKTILAEIASGLQEAHNLGVVHRDLKPENVILTPTRLKILDFGIARMTGFDKRLTQVGFALGSPLYMSPEQIQGITLDSRSDLYSLGVLAYALIAGREPFDGTNSTAIAIQHLQQPAPDLRAVRPDLPAGWSEAVKKLLAKRPEDRFQSGEQVIAALAPLPVE
ncbi:MAG TPA: serine/threonine-protein kinase [Thermoanaerobaculia bacterium]|jgi:tetratricopeptide (TPR) repeat protein|nr:serine/threonine-protein kinase [Thermoanaerobaculia bacterium]